MDNKFAQATANYSQNRTKGVIDAITQVGLRMGPEPSESPSIEPIVDIIDDLIATQDEYFDKHHKEEGRFNGYHYTLTLLQSLCHLTGRE